MGGGLERRGRSSGVSIRRKGGAGGVRAICINVVCVLWLAFFFSPPSLVSLSLSLSRQCSPLLLQELIETVHHATDDDDSAWTAGAIERVLDILSTLASSKRFELTLALLSRKAREQLQEVLAALGAATSLPGAS